VNARTFCHRLRFQLYPPLNLSPVGPIYPNTPIYPQGPIRSTLSVAQFGGPHIAIAIAAGGKRLTERGSVACRHPGEPLGVLALITQGQTKAKAAAKWSEHCRVAERNKNSSFASWRLTLTAFGPARFTAGKAVIAFAYYPRHSAPSLLRAPRLREAHRSLIARPAIGQPHPAWC
jgi:hypothetical protein